MAIFATRSAPKPEEIRSSCREQGQWALDRGDPWGAASVLAGCKAPDLEAQAHWLLANFTEASKAFARMPPHTPTVSEVQAHALAGRLDLAAQAVPRLQLVWSSPDEPACLAAAFEAQRPGSLVAGGSPLREGGSAACHALAQDLRMRGVAGIDEAPRPAWSGDPAIDQVLAILPLTGSPSGKGKVPRFVDFASMTGQDPRARLRRRPMALYQSVFSSADLWLRAEHDADEARDRWAGELRSLVTPDLALLAGYTGQVERLRALLGRIDELARGQGDGLFERSLLDKQPGDPPFFGWWGVSRREMVMEGAWAAYHGGLGDEASRISALTNDSHGARVLEQWKALSAGTGPVDGKLWVNWEPWEPNRTVFELASRDDGGASLVQWLQASKSDGQGVLDRLITRFPEQRRPMETLVERYRPRRWECGLAALLEHAAERRRLARRLGMEALEEQLGPVVGRIERARLDRKLAVPLFLIERNCSF